MGGLPFEHGKIRRISIRNKKPQLNLMIQQHTNEVTDFVLCMKIR